MQLLITVQLDAVANKLLECLRKLVQRELPRKSNSQSLALRVVIPALGQRLVDELLYFSGREIWREIWREFSGNVSDPHSKGSISSGKISEHFSGEIRA